MPNKTKKERRRKVGFTPRLFFCLSKDLLFIVCDTESLCSPPPEAPVEEVFSSGRPEEHVTPLSEWTGLSDTLEACRG